MRATCLRRTKALPALASALQLPRKTERVEAVALAPDERELYNFFKRRSYLLAGKAAEEVKPAASLPATERRRHGAAKAKRNTPGKTPRKTNGNIIVLLSVLRMICDHGEALLPRAALDAWRKHDADRVGWSLLETVADVERSCCVCGTAVGGEEAEKREGEVVGFACRVHVACEACVVLEEDAEPACPACGAAGAGDAASPPPSRGVNSAYAPSSKVAALLRNVVATLQGGHSVDGENPPVKRYVSCLLEASWQCEVSTSFVANAPQCHLLPLDQYARPDIDCTKSTSLLPRPLSRSYRWPFFATAAT